MVTTREVLGAGFALASVSGALVLDVRLGIPATWVDLQRSRKPELPSLAISPDSFASIELKPILSGARMIAGISSGATWSCLERIAREFGYRMTRRSEHEFAAAIAPAGHADRPSMTDDILHAWIMQTAGTSKQRTV